MSVSQEEMSQLLTQSQTSQSSSSSCSLKEIASSGLKILTSPIRGASALYGTWGQAAIHYDIRGFWVLGPVGAGAIASLSNEAVAVLAKINPENKVFQALNKGLAFTDHGLVEFFAHFGMAWDTITTIGVNIAGVQMATNQFGNTFAPVMATLPGLGATMVSYNAEKQPMKRSFIRHTGEILKWMTANGGTIAILSQQGFLAPDSFVPLMVTAGGAAVGALSSGLREKYPGFSRFCDTVIELCFNLSLMASQFNLCMSIVAAANDDEIPESVFYPNFAATMFFYLLLVGNVLFTKASPSKLQTASISEIDEEEKNDSDYKDIEAGHDEGEKEIPQVASPKLASALGRLGVFPMEVKSEAKGNIDNPDRLHPTIN